MLASFCYNQLGRNEDLELRVVKQLICLNYLVYKYQLNYGKFKIMYIEMNLNDSKNYI